MDTATPRHAAAARAILIVVAVVFVGAAAWIARDRLFGIGPTGVHDLAIATANINVCGRDYHSDGTIRTRDEIQERGGALVLVDPAPLAPCPPPSDGGGKPCSGPADGPCATVVYVRVGSDAFADYALRGGP